MRCFLAACPNAATRLALAQVLDDVRQRAAHRRATNVDDLHLTLTFVGELADDVALVVARAAKALQFESIEWRLDLLGFFERAGVVWVGGEPEGRVDRRLLELAADLRRILDRLKVSYDARPLAPHVTLLHGVEQFTNERIKPVVWRIDSVALYRSIGGRSAARYVRVPG